MSKRYYHNETPGSIFRNCPYCFVGLLGLFRPTINKRLVSLFLFPNTILLDLRKRYNMYVSRTFKSNCTRSYNIRVYKRNERIDFYFMLRIHLFSVRIQSSLTEQTSSGTNVYFISYRVFTLGILTEKMVRSGVAFSIFRL